MKAFKESASLILAARYMKKCIRPSIPLNVSNKICCLFYNCL